MPHHIHLVGIGGIGLSAIARVLAQQGYAVSGSDLRASNLIDGLRDLGVTTHVGHTGENVTGAELVVASSAVPYDNAELVAAREAGIPVVKRRDFLGRLTAGREGIAVAGTHGKTTTSAMISVVLERLGARPTYIVGGIVTDLGSNASAAPGKHFVIEADEYDRAFHGIHPKIAIVTNIEMDHPDCYRDMAEMRDAFTIFLGNVASDGSIIACADSPHLMRVLAEGGIERKRVRTYGLSLDADYVVSDVQTNSRRGVDGTVRFGGGIWSQLSLVVPGVHNALNATAALLAADLCRLNRQDAAGVLGSFQGVQRRFEVIGERAGVLVIDDYAHHPTEVRAVLAAARMHYPERRLWAVFQPHTYSRTQSLLPELVDCFSAAHEVIVTDIYAARSTETESIRAEDLAAAIVNPRARHIGGVDDTAQYLLGALQPGDLLMTMGAGDGHLIGSLVLEGLA